MCKKNWTTQEKQINFQEHNIPRLNQEDPESLNRPIATSKIKAVIKKLPEHKRPELDGYTGEFYQTFKEELTLLLF